MTKRNPWEVGLLRFGILFAALGALFIVGVLAVVASGVRLSDTQVPGSRWIASGLLLLITGGVFAVVMAARWDRNHKP